MLSFIVENVAKNQKSTLPSAKFRKKRFSISSIVESVAENRESSSLSAKFRKKRFSIFLKLLRVTKNTRILDIGGTSHTWKGTGLESNITLLNITVPKQSDIDRGFTCVLGDARDMHMFDDKQFDVVFSNSVIEHVGSIEDQAKFANEVRRVGKAYWIQTPNRYFPIEPHALFPFFQFLPDRTREEIALTWKFSHMKKWNQPDQVILDIVSKIRLLTRRELKHLFPESTLYHERFFGVTKSLVSYNLNCL